MAQLHVETLCGLGLEEAQTLLESMTDQDGFVVLVESTSIAPTRIEYATAEDAFDDLPEATSENVIAAAAADLEPTPAMVALAQGLHAAGMSWGFESALARRGLDEETIQRVHNLCAKIRDAEQRKYDLERIKAKAQAEASEAVYDALIETYNENTMASGIKVQPGARPRASKGDEEYDKHYQMAKDKGLSDEDADAHAQEMCYKGGGGGRGGRGRGRRSLPEGVIARVYFEEAQATDRPNRNRRIYEHGHMPHAVADAHERAKAGQLLFLGGHPTPGTHPGMSDVAGIIREVSFNELTGKVPLVLDVLETDPEGTNTLKLLRAGGALPISSRTRGKMRVATQYTGKFGSFGLSEAESVGVPRANREPYFIVSEYRFMGWDGAPGGQSVPGAIAAPDKATFEGTQSPHNTDAHEEGQNMFETLEQLRERAPKLYESLVAELHASIRKDAKLAEGASIPEAIASVKSLTEQNTALTEAVETSKTRIAQLEGQVKDLQEAKPEPEITETAEQKRTRELFEAQDAKIKALEAANHKMRMVTYVHESIYGASNPMRNFADIIEKLIIAPDKGIIPESEEAAKKSIDHINAFINGVLARARKLAERTPALGKGISEANDVAATSRATANRFGDVEEADAYTATH